MPNPPLERLVASELIVEVERADMPKCPRCWKHHGVPEYPQGICDHCAEVLATTPAEDWFFNVGEMDQPQFVCNYEYMQIQIREAVASRYGAVSA